MSEKPEQLTPGNAQSPEHVTAVVTSCHRQDLLELTLRSFFAVQTYKDLDVIVVEDGPASRNTRLAAEFRDRPVTWIATGDRVGQIRAIDFAYARVTTPYIFHMEDDWEFLVCGFIEKSLEILRSRRDCLQVHIRAPNDLNGHPLAVEIEYAGDVPFRRLLPGYQLGRVDPYIWHGFSFNPGLRRLADYRSIGSYAAHSSGHPGFSLRAEEKLGHLFHEKGFYAAVLVDNEGRGYTRHLGSNRHINDALGRRLWRLERTMLSAAQRSLRSAIAKFH